MAILVCQNCGQEVVTTLAKLRAGQKYCSAKCKNESYRIHPTPKRVMQTCLECGTEYLNPQAWIRQGRRKFCSKKCRDHYMRQFTGPKAARYGKKHTSETRDKISKTRVERNRMPCLEDHPNWKGGRYVHNGYVNVMIETLPESQQAMAHKMTTGKYILEHRLVMAMEMGRPLVRGEVVHHINGNKSDNRFKNLMLENVKVHSQAHRELVRRIGELEKENFRLKSLLATCQQDG